MEKLARICCVAGLGILVLFVSACNEPEPPAPKQINRPRVVSKSISRPKSTLGTEDAGNKHSPDAGVVAGPVSPDKGKVDGTDDLSKTGVATLDSPADNGKSVPEDTENQQSSASDVKPVRNDLNIVRDLAEKSRDQGNTDGANGLPNPDGITSGVAGGGSKNIEKEQGPVSDMQSRQDSTGVGQIPGDDDDMSGLPRSNISTPMKKYDSRGRVDPFIPLVAEKNASGGVGSSRRTRLNRELTPLEKLELSQIKLVAVVEMTGRSIAMVEEASGKGYEVSVGTYIGPNGGRVTSITKNSIKIEETAKDLLGRSIKRYEEIKFHKSEDGE